MYIQASNYDTYKGFRFLEDEEDEDYSGRLYFAILDESTLGIFKALEPAVACIDEALQELTEQERERVQYCGVMSAFSEEDLELDNYFTNIEYNIKGLELDD